MHVHVCQLCGVTIGNRLGIMCAFLMGDIDWWCKHLLPLTSCNELELQQTYTRK